MDSNSTESFDFSEWDFQTCFQNLPTFVSQPLLLLIDPDNWEGHVHLVIPKLLITPLSGVANGCEVIAM